MKKFLAIGGASVFLLSACGGSSETSLNVDVETSTGTELTQEQLPSIQPTRNVSYVGSIEPLETSLYMQGTHKLTLADGQFILLDSTDSNLDLELYRQKRVEVRGSVTTTIEGGASILRVEEVTVLDAESLSDSSSSTSAMSSSSALSFCGGIAGIACTGGSVCIDDPSDSCDPASGGADCSGICVTAVSSTSSVPPAAASSKPAVASSSSSVSSSAASAASLAPTSSPEIGPLEAQITLMAKQKYGEASLWTQKYCTSHLSFCVPAHKNWYFKSFGATTTNLWHVEFGMAEIDGLYQGPIVLNLISGNSASMDARDGQIKIQGSDVVAFKDWNGDSHFEIIADARLRAAVEYMLASITSYTTGE